MKGEFLKKLREENGITQRELADMVKVTPKAISFYELNQREPSNTLLLEFSKIFNVSTDYLLGNENISNLNQTPDLIAAHFEGEEWTDEDLESINNFIEFVKSKKGQ